MRTWVGAAVVPASPAQHVLEVRGFLGTNQVDEGSAEQFGVRRLEQLGCGAVDVDHLVTGVEHQHRGRDEAQQPLMPGAEVEGNLELLAGGDVTEGDHGTRNGVVVFFEAARVHLHRPPRPVGVAHATFDRVAPVEVRGRTGQELEGSVPVLVVEQPVKAAAGDLVAAPAEQVPHRRAHVPHPADVVEEHEDVGAGGDEERTVVGVLQLRLCAVDCGFVPRGHSRPPARCTTPTPKIVDPAKSLLPKAERHRGPEQRSYIPDRTPSPFQSPPRSPKGGAWQRHDAQVPDVRSVLSPASETSPRTRVASAHGRGPKTWRYGLTWDCRVAVPRAIAIMADAPVRAASPLAFATPEILTGLGLGERMRSAFG